VLAKLVKEITGGVVAVELKATFEAHGSFPLLPLIHQSPPINLNLLKT
jgi:hypothetical protein